MESFLLELAKVGGPVVVVVGLILYFVYKIVCKILPTVDRLHESVNANTKVTIEMHTFLNNLNGRLRKQFKKEK